MNTNEISALFQDSKGNIWIGAWGGGINLYLTKNANRSIFFDRQEGLHQPVR
ncbi:MAG: hypothetical protein H6573_20465 [Lewinellaceae bacterium]|nr:hypothetical protein [Lewinellaceae bacterium]